MDRTDDREVFFAEERRDPYLAAVTHHAAQAWAMGYEQALRDHGLDETRCRQTHSDRFVMALEWMTDATRKAHAAALVAYAELGKLTTERST